MELDSKIYVCGHSGMYGSAIVRRLKELGYNNIITKTIFFTRLLKITIWQMNQLNSMLLFTSQKNSVTVPTYIAENSTVQMIRKSSYSNTV